MSDERETIADIVAEKRRRNRKKAKNIEDYLTKNPDGSFSGFVPADVANRMMQEALSRGSQAAVEALRKKDAAKGIRW